MLAAKLDKDKLLEAGRVSTTQGLQKVGPFPVFKDTKHQSSTSHLLARLCCAGQAGVWWGTRLWGSRAQQESLNTLNTICTWKCFLVSWPSKFLEHILFEASSLYRLLLLLPLFSTQILGDMHKQTCIGLCINAFTPGLGSLLCRTERHILGLHVAVSLL